MKLKDTGFTAEQIKEKVHKYMIETYERFDFLAETADGMYLYDENGTPYLDFYAGIAVNSAGNCNPKVVAAVKDQLDDIVHTFNYPYAKALSEFDAWLPGFMEKMGVEDLVMITADHGCDPCYMATTDHTREFVPLLILGRGVKRVDVGSGRSFADTVPTVSELFGLQSVAPGKSFAADIL